MLNWKEAYVLVLDFENSDGSVLGKSVFGLKAKVQWALSANAADE